jgi:hypothetical protein
MAEANDYSAITQLNAAASKDAMPLLGRIVLAMIVSIALLYLAGVIANSL